MFGGVGTKAKTPGPHPSHPTGRVPAPDLARGFMLLAIALAHAPLFVRTPDRGNPALNDVITVFHTLFVTNHARPMFAFLFGYSLGRRSMSLYLLQSVVFVAVFYPYGLALQDDLGLTGATTVAVGTWAVSVVIAELLRRAGHRGPAEILLRRLAYR
ncbi:hypothetical protein GCM10009850_043250 [Nonomuraea monospora]|uniref:DUF418 domain-containing protein n=1 Tax=Nonomuraea monospora TaxID=568818 RepID=A0ABN3CHP3_9ACTN